MNVKLQAMLNACRWIEDSYGPTELERVLSAVPPGVRARLAGGIAITWHPQQELLDFLAAAERVLGTGDGRIAERIGAAGASANVSGSLARALFYVARPAFLMRRLAGLWSRFNDEGSMEVLEFADGLLRFEVKGVPRPDALFCATLTGWAGVIGGRFYAERPMVRHVECRARGDERCLWEARWAGISGERSR